MKIICFEPYFHRGTLEHERTQQLRYMPGEHEVTDIEPVGAGAIVRFRNGRELHFPFGTLEMAASSPMEGLEAFKPAPRNEVTVRWDAVGGVAKAPEPPKPPADLEPEVRQLLPEPIPGDPVGPPSGPVIPNMQTVQARPTGQKGDRSR